MGTVRLPMVDIFTPQTLQSDCQAIGFSWLDDSLSDAFQADALPAM